jgi:hypothetical protein
MNNIFYNFDVSGSLANLWRESLTTLVECVAIIAGAVVLSKFLSVWRDARKR